jgi:hypothetical protein
MKKILFSVLSLIYITANSQVLFSDSFNGLTLQNDVQVIGSQTITTTYTTAPASYTLINDGFKNNTGNANSPNKPFNVASLKTTGWAVGYNSIEADTFLVTTSWLDTSAAVQRFIVTPVINSITAASVLSWNALSPDINFPEGYEVYVTTNTTGTLTAADFTATPVFHLADGSTSGGGEKSVWTKHGVSLSAYAGQNIRIAFKDISKNMFQLWIDDIVVENIVNANDVAVSSSPLFYNYNTVNTAGAVFCKVTNMGNANVSALTLNYSVIGVSNETQAFGFSTAMAPYATGDFTFSIPYSIATPGYYKLKIWVNNVNSGPDANVNNDTLNTFICIVTSAPVKNTLVEQFVSAYNGYSPDGQERLKALTSSSVIAINVHDGDSLATTSISSLISTYRKTLATALVDRKFFADVNSVPVARTSYTSHIGQRTSVVVPVSVSIPNKNYDSATRVLTFTVSANFVGEVLGDYRFTAYLTENNIYGPITDTTYNGWNQLSFMYNIPFSPYFQMGYYLPAQNGYLLNSQQYKHQNVLDIALNGAFGSAGTIPGTGGTQGQTYTVTYSYTVPVTPAGQFRYIPENMYIVAAVSEYDPDPNKRTVLNCTQSKMIAKSESFVSVKELNVSSQFVMYPNPSYGVTNILIRENSFKKQVNIRIMDVVGKEVLDQNTNMRFGLIQLNVSAFEAGTYFVIVNDGETRSIKKLIIAK